MTRHKVFISYHHENDQQYKDYFIEKFSPYFIDKSVHYGEYSEDLSTDYIKRLIREEKITDSSIIVVLVGTDTYKRKHVDWEISAGLSSLAGGYSGLLGIILPTYYNSIQNCSLPRNKYLHETIPARLSDNILSGYATAYNWESLFSCDMYGTPNIVTWLDNAYRQKIYNYNRINNGRIQFSYNR